MTARAIVATLALLVSVAGVISASASTLGGARVDALGAATAQTAGIGAVTLDWTGTPDGATWNAASVRMRADSGRFAAGDRIKLTVAGSLGRGPCELRMSPSAATSEVVFGQTAFAACGPVPLERIDTVAVSIAGATTAASAQSSLGEVRTALASYAGALRDAGRSLNLSLESTLVGGVSTVSLIDVGVAGGATAAQLAGNRIEVVLRSRDGARSARFGGVISTDPAAAVRVVPGSGENASPTILIDPRSGLAQSQWPRSGDFQVFSALLTAPQHLGVSASAPAVTLAAGDIPARGGSSVETALDPVDLDDRLAYAYQPPANDTNGLTFCHTFTLTNTSAQPVTWSLTFDTSLPPLWGMDPTASGAFASLWGFATTSYDPASHLWTIGGLPGETTLAPGQTHTSMGYCAQNVPQPPMDPSAFTTEVSVVPGSGEWNVQLQLSVRSEARWNVPWEITVDLADYVCAASLAGHPVTFSRVEATPVPGSATKYTLRGTAGDTRYVSASHPRDVIFASYAPGYGGWHAPCR